MAITPLSGEYSFSSEKTLNDEKVYVKVMGFNSLTRSQASKEKKRVRQSFRLSDIIILYNTIGGFPLVVVVL